jgi:hypothetical protein
MEKTHWKKWTNPDYIGTYILSPGEEKTVKIKKVIREMVTGMNGKKEECTVAHLENEKPFILNRTNCKIIAKLYNSPYIEDWPGKLITIYAAKVNAFGEEVDGLRIRQNLPTPFKLPDLTPTHPKWGDVATAIQNGFTIEQVKTKYAVSPDNEKLLLEYLNDKP